MDDGARADRRAGADCDERADRHRLPNAGVGRDDAHPVDACGRCRRAREQRDGTRKRGIRIVGVQHRAPRTQARAVGAGDDHRRRPRGREFGQVLSIGDEREVARLRLRDTGHADNLHVAVTVEAALQPFCDVP